MPIYGVYTIARLSYDDGCYDVWSGKVSFTRRARGMVGYTEMRSAANSVVASLRTRKVLVPDIKACYENFDNSPQTRFGYRNKALPLS